MSLSPQKNGLENENGGQVDSDLSHPEISEVGSVNNRSLSFENLQLVPVGNDNQNEQLLDENAGNTHGVDRRPMGLRILSLRNQPVPSLNARGSSGSLVLRDQTNNGEDVGGVSLQQEQGECVATGVTHAGGLVGVGMPSFSLVPVASPPVEQAVAPVPPLNLGLLDYCMRVC